MKLWPCLLLSCLIASTMVARAQAQEGFETLEGSPITLKSHMDTAGKNCRWKLATIINVESEYPARNPPGYTISGDYENGYCELQIQSVNRTDDGQWLCSILSDTVFVEEYIPLNVVVPPQSVYLRHNGSKLAQNEFKTVFVTSPSYGVAVECVSERSKPEPISVEWKVNGGKVQDHKHKSDHHDDAVITHTIESTIFVQFPIATGRQKPLSYRYDPDLKYEKTVECTILPNKYQRPLRVSATFGHSYATTAVRLTEHHFPNDKSRVLLFCEANGIPIPTYRIQRISNSTAIPTSYQSNEKWAKSSVEGQSQNVTERGYYVCRATYGVETGNVINVFSNHVRLKFGQEDPEDPTPEPTTADPNNAASFTTAPPTTRIAAILLTAILILISKVLS